MLDVVNMGRLADTFSRLYPSLFTPHTERRFQEAFDLSLGKFDPAFLDAVQRLLELIMLRRTKKTVELTVPPLEELVVFLRQLPIYDLHAC